MNKADRINRYLAIVYWARKRYASDFGLVTWMGGVPSTYTQIERLAARRYLGCTR
jgi:hypothetical protein